MSFFRREKDPNEEWQRTRHSFEESLTRDKSEGAAPEPEAEPNQWAAGSPREGSGYSLSEARSAASEPAAPTDPLAGYREGATMVARDSAISGTLRSQSHLFVEGTFEGEMEAEATVIISETAQVKATVRARDVIVAGTLNGKVEARGRFHAMPTARIVAEVTSASLKIEQGSQINCQFAMQAQEEGHPR